MFVAGVLLNMFIRSPSITALISYIQYIDRQCVFCLMMTGRIVIISIAVHICEIMFISLFYCLYVHLLKPPKQQHIRAYTGLYIKGASGGWEGGTLNRFN